MCINIVQVQLTLWLPWRPSSYSNTIMNHDSGFIIGMAMIFAKTLIEHTLKSHLKKHPSAKITLKFFFTINLGLLVSSKKEAVCEYHPKLKFAILFIFILIFRMVKKQNFQTRNRDRWKSLETRRDCWGGNVNPKSLFWFH